MNIWNHPCKSIGSAFVACDGQGDSHVSGLGTWIVEINRNIFNISTKILRNFLNNFTLWKNNSECHFPQEMVWAAWGYPVPPCSWGSSSVQLIFICFALYVSFGEQVTFFTPFKKLRLLTMWKSSHFITIPMPTLPRPRGMLYTSIKNWLAFNARFIDRSKLKVVRQSIPCQNRVVPFLLRLTFDREKLSDFNGWFLEKAFEAIIFKYIRY